MTMAVGHIVHADQAEAIVREGRADLTALAREIMYNPNWPMDAAQKLGADPNFDLVPPPYFLLAGQARQVCLRRQAINMDGRARRSRRDEALTAMHSCQRRT
jgi:NADH:flavin oxidoreductase / NADH oxidase family